MIDLILALAVGWLYYDIYLAPYDDGQDQDH